MIDYNLMYREELPLEGDWSYNVDIFISAFNSSDRVKRAYEEINAVRKYWWILPDYEFEKEEYPGGELFDCSSYSGNPEADVAVKFLAEHPEIINGDQSICIDITGFVKPYMMSFIALLVLRGIKKIDVIYSEPQHYSHKHNTKFSGENLIEVRQVAGYEGEAHTTYGATDALIIGTGYDHTLINAVAEEKKVAKKKIQIFGFPSLRADMYQENILRASKASDTVDREFTLDKPFNYLAPANDPFATASCLQEIFQKHSESSGWYLSPLATKSQALGFVLFYLNECRGKPVSIIYPFCKTHEKKTSEEVVRIWKYTLEFPNLTLSL